MASSFPIESSEDIGKFIAIVRKRRKLTQAELAGLSGTGRRFLSELENGKPTVQFTKVLKILKTLKISLLAETPLEE